MFKSLSGEVTDTLCRVLIRFIFIVQHLGVSTAFSFDLCRPFRVGMKIKDDVFRFLSV